MYYYEETDNEVIKYEVELDIEKLIKLKNKIVEKCSNITQCVKEDDINESSNKERVYPKLVEYIDLIIVGNFNQAYDKLKRYTSSETPEEKAKKYYKKIKEELIDYLNSDLDYISIFSLDYYVRQIKIAYGMYISNKYQNSDMEYYDDVMNCIKLKEVDRINKDIIRKVEEFQGTSYIKKKD